MAKPFNPLQALILKKLAEGMFFGCDVKISSRQIVANIQDQFALIKGNVPTEIGASLLVVAGILGGPIFPLLSASAIQKRIERRIKRTNISIVKDLARIRGVLYAGYYGHWDGVTAADNAANPVLGAMGYTLPPLRDRTAAGERKVTPKHDRDLPPSAFVTTGTAPTLVDVIVIGSGAGGAVAAANLAGHGHDVLILERGDHHPTTNITHRESHMTAQLYKDGALQMSRNHDIVLFQGSAVGGSTLINNGICLRVNQAGHTHPDAEDVVTQWNAHGAPITHAMLDAAYLKVERRLGIKPVSAVEGRRNGPHLLDGWASHAAGSSDVLDQRAVATWFSKNWGPDNAHACVYCGYCNTGCAYGRRFGMCESFLADATSTLRPHPAKIFPGAPVEEILWGPDSPDGKRVARGVRIRFADQTAKDILARKGVVVAAGTMASSRILSASGVTNAGSGLSLNLASPVVALMPAGTTQRAWDEDQMTTYIDRADFLIESHFQPPMSMATLMPGWFKEHFTRMHNYNRLVSAGVLIPINQLGHTAGDSMSIQLGAAELALLRKALATLTKVHFAAGAIEVYPPLLLGPTLKRGMSDVEIDQFYAEAIIDEEDVTLSSSHSQGGNPISADPTRGVVDPQLRLHHTTNVMVTDASVFPSCIRVNAQLTTMAIAQMATTTDPF